MQRGMKDASLLPIGSGNLLTVLFFHKLSRKFCTRFISFQSSGAHLLHIVSLFFVSSRHSCSTFVIDQFHNRNSKTYHVKKGLVWSENRLIRRHQKEPIWALIFARNVHDLLLFTEELILFWKAKFSRVRDTAMMCEVGIDLNGLRVCSLDSPVTPCC